jgi:hypothetical protein
MHCRLSHILATALCLAVLLVSGAGHAQRTGSSKVKFTLTATKDGKLQVTNSDGTVQVVKPKRIPKLMPPKREPKPKLNVSSKPTPTQARPQAGPITDKKIETMLRKRPNKNRHRLSAYRPPPKPRAK